MLIRDKNSAEVVLWTYLPLHELIQFPRRKCEVDQARTSRSASQVYKPEKKDASTSVKADFKLGNFKRDDSECG